MKKTFTKLSIIALSFITINATAQIKLGVTGGTQITFAKTDFFTAEKAVATPTFGIVAQMNLGSGFMFRPNVNYIQDGLKNFESIRTQISPSISELSETSTTIKMQSLQIPLDLVLGLKAGKGKFLLSAAPVVTIGLKAKYSETETITRTGATTQTGTNSANLEFTGANAFFERVDWGTRFGLGYEFKNGLQLNAAYKAGLNDIATGSDSYKNNSIALTLSYFFIK